MDQIHASELITKVKKLEAEIEDLGCSLKELRDDRNWERDVEKDERPSVKLLHTRYKSLKQQLKDINDAWITPSERMVELLSQ